MGAIKVVYGPPCAGKSTHVRESSAEDDVVVDYDAIASSLGSRTPHHSSGDQRNIAFQVRRLLVDLALAGEIKATTWVIHTNPKAEDVERYADAGADFILIDPGMDECLARAKDRPEGTEGAIRSWYDQPPAMPCGKDSNRNCAMEYKRLDISALELKFGDDGTREFEGYASVFSGVDSYGDTIAPGAYAKTIQERSRPIRMRWNHYGPVIGKWEEVREDEKGLYVRGTLTPGHSVAEDVYASMRHQAVDGMSIGYRVVKSSEEGVIRKLEEIELVEISVVEEPADLGAQVEQVKNLNSLIAQCESYKELESLLREAAGLSRSNATCIVSRIKAISLGEQESKQSTIHDEVIKQLTMRK